MKSWGDGGIGWGMGIGLRNGEPWRLESCLSLIRSSGTSPPYLENRWRHDRRVVPAGESRLPTYVPAQEEKVVKAHFDQK